MELKLNTAVVDCYEKVFTQTVRQEETQTAVVPEALPDIGSILCASGTALIRGKDVEDGRIRLEANVPVRISYCPEEGEGVRGLEVNVPLYLSLEDANIPERGVCVADISLVAVEAKLLNPRKVSVRVEAAFTVDCYAEGQLAFEGAPESAPAESVNVLQKRLTVTPVRAVTEKTFVLVDEFNLPAAISGADTVLNQQTAVAVEDVQATGSKLIVKGSVKSCVFCADADGSAGAVEFSTGFSQIIDLGRAPEGEVFAAVSVLLSGAHYDIGGEGRTGSAELHLVAQVVAREKAEVSCLADAYSNRRALELECDEREVRRVKAELCLRASLREALPTECAVASVVQSCAVPGTPRTEEDKVSVPVSVCLLYRDADGCPRAEKRKYEAAFSYELQEGEALFPVSAGVSELYVSPVEEGAEVRMTLELRAFLTETETVKCVTGLSWDEAAEADIDAQARPTLVILRACAKDDLWTIAKQNCSTVAAIIEANGIDPGDGSWEKLILVPKTV